MRKEKLKILIADDESFARDELKHILSKIDNVKIVGEARNGIEALKMTEKLLPDILLLDIEMPGLNGIEVAKRLLEKKFIPKIIFSTAYNAYAVSAFEVNAIDYILKPFEGERIKKGLLKAESLIDRENISLDGLDAVISRMAKEKHLSKIPVKSKNKINFIGISDIVYAKGEGGLVYIYENGKEHLTDYGTLEKLQADLDPVRFHRSHRSYLVNLEMMKEIIPLGSGYYTIKLKTSSGNYVEIPLSRRQAKTLKEKYKF